jgi:hypothetical protein
MDKIYWKQKLSSRKFWSLLGGLAVTVGALIGLSEDTTSKIVALISSVGLIVAYLFAESYVDGKRAENNNNSLL